jgi:glycosyltransferase involved in cell wall biosynthesis
MSFHLLLPRVMDLPQAAARAARHEQPRHAMAELAASLAATIHEPDAAAGTAFDRLRSLVAPPGALWSAARRVLQSAGPGDAVFCSSEAGGLQVAALGGRRRPRLALFVHNVDRPRARFALKAWRMADKVDLFMACSTSQVEFLRRHLHLSDDRVRHVWDHTDTRFFTPGPASPGKRRPVVVSVGLEQRDYRTLAVATEDMDVDVRISGFSKDAAALARIFPDPMPANMSRRFYEWPELVQLYRDADVVVVSCHENRYAAGVQSLMEASACRRPVVATATEGLAAYVDDCVVAVRPGDVAAMREAIQRSLHERASAEARASRAHRLANERYGMDRYVSEIDGALRRLV